MCMAVTYDINVKALRVQPERMGPESVILVEFPARDKDYENDIDKVIRIHGDTWSRVLFIPSNFPSIYNKLVIS